MIRCKRVYEAAAADDGQRVLVDRLWPRNLRKENLHAQWLREVAPSDDLRKALHQGEVDFAGFTQRYQRELAAHPEYWYPLLDLAGKGPLTLLYAARTPSTTMPECWPNGWKANWTGVGLAVHPCAMPNE